MSKREGFVLTARRACRRRQVWAEQVKQAAAARQRDAWDRFAERASELAEADQERRGRE